MQSIETGAESEISSFQSQQLPPLRPIRRLRALMRYRFGWMVVATLSITLALILAPPLISILGDSLVSRDFPGVFWLFQLRYWGLGAAMLVLLAAGGIPEAVVGSNEDPPTKPDRWIPDYNGLHRTGLALAMLLLLDAGLSTVLTTESEIVLNTESEIIFQLSFGLALLPEVAGATTAWIVLRRTLILVPVVVARIPFVGRVSRYLRPEYLYLTVVFGLFSLFLHWRGITNPDEIVSQAPTILGALLIFWCLLLGTAALSYRPTARSSPRTSQS
jgi:hypothetical protein